MKKTIITLGILGLCLIGGNFAKADTTVDAQLKSISDITAQIQALQKQIKDLQTQSMTAQQTQHTQVGQLISSLSQGSSGDDVKILQALLALDQTIYPEGLISGVYGPLTAKAVKKFQEKNGLEGVGRVGPKTLKKLNEWLKQNPVGFEDDHGDGKDKGERKICAKVPPGHVIAPGWLKKHDGKRENVPICQTLPPSIGKKVDNDNRDDEDDQDDDRGNHGTTTPRVPDIIAPIISSLGSSVISSTTARVGWFTNEPATGKLFYSTTTPVQTGTATVKTATGFTILHTFELTGLTASSTYRYVVESKDVTGNIATSSEKNFLTQ